VDKEVPIVFYTKKKIQFEFNIKFIDSKMNFGIYITLDARKEFLSALREIRYGAEDNIKVFEIINERNYRPDLNDLQVERINKI
jgi:hypothetical protein